MGVEFELSVERRVSARGAILAIAEIAVHANRRRLLSGHIQAIKIDQVFSIGLIASEADGDACGRASMIAA